jgi:uncharacterized protein (TIGR02246 family)
MARTVHRFSASTREYGAMNHEDLTKELLELERDFWRALKENDVESAVALTDFPCILTGPQGVGLIEEPVFAEMMKNAPYTLDDYRLDDKVEVRLLGEHCAVLAYKVHEDLTVDGAPVSIDAAESSTWARRDGRWRCALHTEAMLGDPFGRDRAPRRDESNESTDTDERAIRQLMEDWMVAARLGDLPRLLRMMSDDVVFNVPGEPPFGKDRFAAAFEKTIGKRMDIENKILELSVHGDWAFCRALMTVTMTPPGSEPKSRTGYVLTIFKKNPNGDWVVARDANMLDID